MVWRASAEHGRRLVESILKEPGDVRQARRRLLSCAFQVSGEFAIGHVTSNRTFAKRYPRVEQNGRVRIQGSGQQECELNDLDVQRLSVGIFRTRVDGARNARCRGWL